MQCQICKNFAVEYYDAKLWVLLPSGTFLCRTCAAAEIERLQAIVSDTYKALYDLPSFSRTGFTEEDEARVIQGVEDVCCSLENAAEGLCEAARKERDDAN